MVKIRSKKYLFLIFLFLLILACKEHHSRSSRPYDSNQTRLLNPEWKTTTPMGIEIGANNSTIAQYEEHWNSSWEYIEWPMLDKIFLDLKEYYCYTLDWNCKDSYPNQLKVYIMSWDDQCHDEENPNQPYETYVYLSGYGWVCVDGWFPYQSEPGVTYIHLGDDPGIEHSKEIDSISQIYYAFEESAYPHELLHFFQWVSGLEVTDKVPISILGASDPPSKNDVLIHCPEEN